MDAEVVAHLGVEGRRHDRTLLDRHDPIPDAAAQPRSRAPRRRAGVLDPRCADEHGVDGVVEDREVDVALEGVDLPAEGVAPHGDVEPAEGLLSGDAVAHPVGEHDHPGARAEDRHAGLDAVGERVEQVEGAGQLDHRGGLSAGHDERVAPLELVEPADGERARRRAPTARRGAHVRHLAARRRRSTGGSHHQPSEGGAAPVTTAVALGWAFTTAVAPSRFPPDRDG